MNDPIKNFIKQHKEEFDGPPVDVNGFRLHPNNQVSDDVAARNTNDSEVYF